jgi:hypothetical protein
MKQTFTVGTCRYTVSVIHGADQIRAKIRKMPPSDAPYADLWNSVTEEVLLADRVAEITELAHKCKPRKPTVKADSRVYPRLGAEMSTAVYVRDYHQANAHRYNRDSVKDWIKTFYQPLSTRITPIEGEDACLSGL